MARQTTAADARDTALAAAPLSQQIREAEARLARRRDASVADVATLGRSLRQRLGSPVVLALGAGAGFLLGEFVPRRNSATVRIGGVALLRMLLQALSLTQLILSMLPEDQRRQLLEALRRRLRLGPRSGPVH